MNTREDTIRKLLKVFGEYPSEAIGARVEVEYEDGSKSHGKFVGIVEIHGVGWVAVLQEDVLDLFWAQPTSMKRLP